MMRRVPIDSAAPVVVFALARLVVSIGTRRIMPRT